MAQPTGRPRGRPPGSKNKSTLERERKEKEKVLNESRDEIVNEVVKKVEKMVDNKMDVTTPPKGDRGIVLGGFAGTYQKVAQKGQFSLLKSEQFGDRAYMVLLKGKKVVAKDIATMNDARVVKAIGRAHKVRKGGVVEDIVMDLSLITEEIDNQISRIKDISGDADIMNVWDMLESANRLILNASNELESLGIEKSKKSNVRKSSKPVAKDTSARDVPEYTAVKSVYEGIEELMDDVRRTRVPEVLDRLISKWAIYFGDISVPGFLDSARGKYDEMYEQLANARQEAYRFYEGQMAWSPTTGEEGNWVNKSRKSHVKKDTYGDNLSPEDEVRVRGMISQIRAIEDYVDRAYRAINTEAYGLESVPGFQQMFQMAEGFGDVEITNAIWDYKKSIEEYAKAIRAQNIPKTDGRWPQKFSDELEWRLREFISGKYVTPYADTHDDPIEDADYDISQYEIKSKKGSQSKAPVKDDRGSIGIDIEKMIRARKESKEKPETDVDEPIEAPDEPPVTQGEKPETNPDEPIEAPSEPAVSDKGKDDDISSLESSAGPTVIANGNDGSELDIDIDLDDDEDLEKMMARKERMQSQAEPPGRTQPFANNYRTVQMGAGKFNPMDMPKGRNVKP